MSAVLLRPLSASVWMHLQPLLSCARPFIPFICGEELRAALQGRTGNVTTKTWEAHFQFAACQHKQCVSLEIGGAVDNSVSLRESTAVVYMVIFPSSNHSFKLHKQVRAPAKIILL